MIRFPSFRPALAGFLSSAVMAAAQTPFQFPTANHALYDAGAELKFIAPTAPDRSWTTGSFGCVRTDGWQMHEGIDIVHLQTNRHGEPTDPILATADGTVMYVNPKGGDSNYGKYVVIRHLVDGLEIYSLYGHLSEIASGIVAGKSVKAGETIATMGRTGQTIAKDRAHLHFELNVLVNDNFPAWFKKNSSPYEHNDHGVWNGQNLDGLDPREILLAEHNPAKPFSLVNYLRSQTELCRVLVRATNFPYLKRYAALVLKNPKAEKEGIAGYEVAFNYNGVVFALMPRAASEIKGVGRVQLLSVNEAEYHAHPCRKLVVQHGSHWQLTDKGLREADMLTY
jgi:murein DD-endopeptidase MepM/ murein hydrolase activator NlpD